MNCFKKMEWRTGKRELDGDIMNQLRYETFLSFSYFDFHVLNIFNLFQDSKYKARAKYAS